MPVGMNRMDYHGGCHWTVTMIVGALILIKIWHNKEWVLRHPPSSDPSFSRTACATGALPLLTGADPFSSSSFFSRVSNACWEEHDGSYHGGCHWTVWCTYTD
jgi:hypothetical protein